MNTHGNCPVCATRTDALCWLALAFFIYWDIARPLWVVLGGPR